MEPNSIHSVELDEFDRKVIAILREESRTTVTDLARRVGLSKTPGQARCPA